MSKMSNSIRCGSRQVDQSYYDKLIALQPLARAALHKLDRSIPVQPLDEPKKLCRKRGETWPATTEFFYRDSKTGNYISPCKACQYEKRAESNAVTPCAVPGCDEPRHHWRASYCYEHRYHAQQKARKLGSVQGVTELPPHIPHLLAKYAQPPRRPLWRGMVQFLHTAFRKLTWRK